MSRISCTIILLSFVLIKGVSAQNTDSTKIREQLAFQFIYDSLYKQIDLNWLDTAASYLCNDTYASADSAEHFKDSIISDAYGKEELIKVPISDQASFFKQYLSAELDSITCNEFIEFNAEIRSFNWPVEKIKRKKWLAIDSINCKYFSCSSWIAYPVFNKDRTIMILQAGEVHGPLSGYGFTALYAFKDGEWEKMKVLVYWVS